MRIRISWSGGEVLGELNDSAAARSILEVLPCTSEANTWGEEVYFSLPVSTALDPNATDVVEPGTICYWVQGKCLALPFGPTPVSRRKECRLVTAVNILGKLDGNPRVLAGIRDGDAVTVAPAT
jgi:hypothetical protein